MDYDVRSALETIENELIESMMRNFMRHRAEEDREGYRWSQWQAEQLKSLEKYRKVNAEKYGGRFTSINAKISHMLEKARADGNADQEIAILEAIQNGFKAPTVLPNSMTGEFFKLNDRKLEALIKATTDDFEKAETAILRRANDQYRSAIFNAQVYVNTGAGTYEKAIDMACRDMLRSGLACVEYSNGARHTLSDYADMALRTANKRAYLYGEGEKRKEWGLSLVVVNSRQGGCSKCAEYIGKIFIDDVYSGGTESDGNYPLLSTAIEGGLFHPRCKDSTSTYYEGITTLKPVSKEEMAEMERREKLEEQQLYYKNQAKKNKRIADNSLDKDNQRIFQFRADENTKKSDEIAEKLTKSIAKSDSSGIMELTRRKGAPHRRIGNNGQQIIDKATYNKLTRDFEKNGGIIIRGKRADKHLGKGKTASYLPSLDTAFIKDEPTVSDVLEEMYHAKQDRLQMFGDTLTEEVRLRREIDAQEYLLSLTDKYKIPDNEVETTKSNLEYYKSQLHKLLQGG